MLKSHSLVILRNRLGLRIHDKKCFVLVLPEPCSHCRQSHRSRIMGTISERSSEKLLSASALLKAHNLNEGKKVLGGRKLKKFMRGLMLIIYDATKKKGGTQFQYDPKSYALNFDDGIGQENDDAVHAGHLARSADTLPRYRILKVSGYDPLE